MVERMVAKQAPRFEIDAVMPNKEFGKVSLEEVMKQDKWTMLFFYPMDFTFVCQQKSLRFQIDTMSLRI
ncbi:tryparedoxin peroxidase [Bacillus clarus]|uniref:Tryparedoxin peroxidase n=1 Tax=Bacillus clarus TaxID=2338372 RepID=A0A090YZF7_9BACI|nr:tryparedoxin peroxidase [Bacillus clarus]